MKFSKGKIGGEELCRKKKRREGLGENPSIIVKFLKIHIFHPKKPYG